MTSQASAEALAPVVWNMLVTVVVLLMTKLLKSKDCILSQPENMLFMLVTLLVSKLLKSRDFRLTQPENMLFILVTLLVSKLLKSNVVKQGQ